MVSSRNWPEIEKALGRATEKSWLSLELNEKSVSAAVATYIKIKVERLAEDNEYDDDTRCEVNRYLTENADGTFLWVALVCQELADISGWKVDRDILTMFPPGLDGLYNRMMKHISDSKDAQLCKNILAAIFTAYRPIKLEELESLVELPPKVSSNHKALAEIIGLCGSFLTLRDLTVSFVHQSAKDFLSGKGSKTVFPSGKEAEHQSVSLRSIKAMSRILRRDIYILVHPGTSIEEVERKRPSPDPLAPIRYACTYWVDHLCEIESHYDVNAIDSFLREHLLHWFEALGLLRGTSEGAHALIKLVPLLEVSYQEALNGHEY